MCALLSMCALCVMNEALSSILVTLAVDKPVMGYNIVCVLWFLSSIAAPNQSSLGVVMQAQWFSLAPVHSDSNLSSDSG